MNSTNLNAKYTVPLYLEDSSQVEISNDLIERIKSTSMYNTLQSMIGIKKLNSNNSVIGKIFSVFNNENNLDYLYTQTVTVNPYSILLIQPDILISKNIRSMFKIPFFNVFLYSNNEFAVLGECPIIDKNIKEFKLHKLIITAKYNNQNSKAKVQVVSNSLLPVISDKYNIPLSSEIVNNNQIINEKEFLGEIKYRYIPKITKGMSDIGTTNNITPILNSDNDLSEISYVSIQQLINKFNNSKLTIEESEILSYILKISRDTNDFDNIINMLTVTNRNQQNSNFIILQNNSDEKIKINLDYNYIYVENSSKPILYKQISKTDENILTVFSEIANFTADKDIHELQEEFQNYNNKNSGFFSDLWNKVKETAIGPLKELAVSTVDQLTDMIRVVLK